MDKSNDKSKMKTIILNFVCLFGFILFGQSQTVIKFNNIDSLFSYANQNSAVIKTNDQQTLLAKYEKIAALANVINFRNPVSLSLTDNTELPVNFIPSELLGGKPGSYKALTFGQKYVSNFGLTPQIDIINTANWAQIKSANINVELTATQNLINKKTLYESLSACYFNICSLKEQVKITQQNNLSADTILLIITNKFSQGLVRQQDVNDATINKLALDDKLAQLNVSLEQQCNSLRILCDIKENTALIFDDELNYNQNFDATLNVNSQLNLKAATLQSQYAKQDLRVNRFGNFPVLTFLYNDSWYQNSNEKFFDNSPDNKFLNSVFVGAKLTFFLPDVNHILLSRNSKIAYNVSLINLEHNKLKADIDNNQLQLDYQKAYSQFITSKKVFQLKQENYTMAVNQYNESLLPADKLLIAFNDMLASRFNYSSALASLLYTKSKIDIENKIK